MKTSYKQCPECLRYSKKSKEEAPCKWCLDDDAELNRQWREQQALKSRMKKYKLSVEEFETLHIAQDSKCAICNKERELVVDHDHTTGAVRGLLCGSCNSGLGHFEDSLQGLLKAVAYLSKGIQENEG